jgi:hypothetical protein
MRHKTSVDIFNYWESIRGFADAPLRTQIDPAAVRHILSELFILEAAPSDTDAPTFRLAGTKICSIFGRELRDESFSSLWAGSQPDDPVKIAAGVMAHAVPALINATGYGSSGRHMAFEMVLMPMKSSSNAGCDRLLGCLTPALNATWFGAEPLEFLALDRSRLLTERIHREPEAREAPEMGRSVFASKGGELGDTVRRMLHLRIFDGGRAR